VAIVNSWDNTVGGTSPAARNVISGNGSGVQIVSFEFNCDGAAARNKVQGNFIGTDKDGTADLGNTASGVFINEYSRLNTIGGTASGAGNIISGNGGNGVTVASSGNFYGRYSGNGILSNSIYSNDELGIDLGPSSGVTANDTDDTDTGANDLQNFPVVSSAVRESTTSTTTISGTLKSSPSQTYTIQCFLTEDGGDPSGHGEGKTLLDTTTTTTDENGDSPTFSCASNVPTVGDRVSTTATNTATGDTSEFSGNVQVTSSTDDSASIPDTTITSGPSGTVSSTTASFAFSSNESNATFECKLDDGAFESCTSPKEYNGLSDGSHTFYVKATDAAGNTDASPASRTWTVDTTTTDTTAPDTSMSSGPNGPTNDSTPTFAFSGSDDTTASGDLLYSHKIDGEEWSSYSPDTIATRSDQLVLSDGAHTFYVKAKDEAANEDSSPAEHSFNVDTAVPTAQPPARGLVADSTLGTTAVPVQLLWSATDVGSGVAGYQLQQSVNGGAYADVSLPSQTTTALTVSLDLGKTYQYQVRAQDKAGNWSAWATGPSFTLQAVQENGSGVSYPAGKWTRTALSDAYGGYVKHTSASGARAQFAFTGDEVAWVSTKGANRGKAEVWLDGVKVATVDLYSASTQTRQVVFSQGGLDPSKSHTLEVRVLGTKNAASSGKRVDVDAFVALR
jgi:hypothetical protein